MNLADFLGVGHYLPERDFAKPVMGLIEATTRALNAYADNAGKPKLSYVITNHSGSGDYGTGIFTPEAVQTLHHRDSMQKGTD